MDEFTLTTDSKTFSKRLRLLLRSDFLKLSVSKTSITKQCFIAIWQINNLSHPRIGITASKKTGNSVVRNRIKRHIREFFRNQRSMLPAVDLNIIVRRKAAFLSYAALFNELQVIFKQIGSSACCQKY